jgi:Thiamine pyrophosphate enzyme, N-terminal TPP binding domain
MAKAVADCSAEILDASGVERRYGIIGDSLNALSDVIGRQGKIEWVHARHEEVAPVRGGPRGELAVCAGSCGSGNLHPINGLFDCHRSRVPVLSIAVQIPSTEIGAGYFQETPPQELLRERSHDCAMLSATDQMARVLEVAVREAVGRLAVAGGVIAGDVALQPANDAPPPRTGGLLPPRPVVLPDRSELDRLTALLNDAGQVRILCGLGCAGAHNELLARVARLKAPMVHALCDKEHVEWDNSDIEDEWSGDGSHKGTTPRKAIQCGPQPGDHAGASRHDRTDRIFVQLLRDARLRCAADARHRFSLPTILSSGGGRPHSSCRYQGRERGPPRLNGSRHNRRCRGDAKRLDWARRAARRHIGDGDGVYSLHGEGGMSGRRDAPIDLVRTNLWR